MIIESEAVGPFFKNGFVVGCETTRDAVLIDPGDEVATLLASADRQKFLFGHDYKVQSTKFKVQSLSSKFKVWKFKVSG